PFGFQFLHQVGDLDDRRITQLIYNFCLIQSHFYLSFVSSSSMAMNGLSPLPAKPTIYVVIVFFRYHRLSGAENRLVSFYYYAAAGAGAGASGCSCPILSPRA